MSQNEFDLTDRVTAQGRAIQALGTIEPSGLYERTLARLLMAAYKRRLRAIVMAALIWVKV